MGDAALFVYISASARVGLSVSSASWLKLGNEFIMRQKQTRKGDGPAKMQPVSAVWTYIVDADASAVARLSKQMRRA